MRLFGKRKGKEQRIWQRLLLQDMSVLDITPVFSAEKVLPLQKDHGSGQADTDEGYYPKYRRCCGKHRTGFKVFGR